MARRLELATLPDGDPLEGWTRELKHWLDERLGAAEWTQAMATLSEAHALKEDDKLETARGAVLAKWENAQQACAALQWDAAFAALCELRGAISTAGQAKNWDPGALAAVRDAMKTLRVSCDETLKPVTKDEMSWELDLKAAALFPSLRDLAARALDDYQALKDQVAALDFDDLEALAVHLLTREARPQAGYSATESEPGDGVRAILVDEFQDTNERQRQIVYALAGLLDSGASRPAPANLFIVGDAKQSIYRFRGADVTVFRGIQGDIERLGGQVLNLDLTFRAHAALLKTIQDLLTPLMGTAEDPARPYHVPFAPPRPYRTQPRDGVAPPFVEFQIGLGDAEGGRRAAAAALATRLRELHEREGFDWAEMALLFRASTAFPIYEDALQAAGIPFVTVAGKGFYDRPEIRDVLNALTAIADPSDDLALAGLLRSPAFGLGDADLYHLRFPEGGEVARPLYASLIANARYAGTASAIAHLHGLAGRLTVAELLKAFLDRTHYRAILRAGSGAGRLSRNVDKLLADAHRSRLVAVGDFLEYVQALRDVGAREGEAPAEVGGAVQLMTVHKSKGLEFPMVVLADAAYEHRGGGGDGVLLDSTLGLLLKVTADGARPAAWQVGLLADEDRDEAEELRLLYVAATRAQEKLIVSGHARVSLAKSDPGRLLLSGWLKQLGSVIGLDDVRLAGDAPEGDWPVALAQGWAQSVRAVLHTLPAAAAQVEPPPPTAEKASTPGPLIAPIVVAHAAAEGENGRDRAWRVIPAGRSVPAWVVGQLVHEALRRWCFPAEGEANVRFEARLRPAALKAGLIGEAAQREALREAARLLSRFRAHPLFAEMDTAAEQYHDVPYIRGDDVDVIDDLYRVADGWRIVDFKTDELRDDQALGKVLPGYRARLKRHVEAVITQMNLAEQPRAQLVFLNLQGAVRVMRLEDNDSI
jgi:ATP-dependent helicase/nuclease subunit A